MAEARSAGVYISCETHIFAPNSTPPPLQNHIFSPSPQLKKKGIFYRFLKPAQTPKKFASALDLSPLQRKFLDFSSIMCCFGF